MAYIEKDIFINNELIPLVKRLDLCHPKQKKGVLMAIQKLNEEPSADVVEVVRCKDCKYGEEQVPVYGVIDYKCLKTKVSCLSATDFCSYGEKKECEGK